MRAALIASSFLLAACADGAPAANPDPKDRPFQVQAVADFESPWAMAFLPDGRLLVTEKAGAMKLLTAEGGTISDVAGVPAVDSAGQGGLMDVAPAPGFAENGILYFSFSETGAGGKGVALARARLAAGQGGAARLENVQVIFRAAPYVQGNGHYSGRIAFSPDGKYLFFTNGERQKFEPAQDPKSTLGKVLRLNLDGTPAEGNPLATKGFHPAVWSYGHRNLLGIAFDSAGRLWEQEMGPKGGDEINLIKPGLNYGYPRVSNGDHYDGRPIPDHAPGDDFEAPKLSWNPAISPAGLTYYNGAMFPQWQGSLFLGGLSGKALVRVKLDGEAASKGDQWDMGERIRDVEQGPDGALWLIEDGQRGGSGGLLKLTPAG